ncbi:hypothetical protein GCM10012288_11780 [Malaciobacter pacificus]|jgi:hypothetical protein|nr:hypothetical protein GCM10012288_11780 [Malaciobacter pacificus]
MNVNTYDAYYNNKVSSEDIKGMFKIELGIIVALTILILI